MKVLKCTDRQIAKTYGILLVFLMAKMASLAQSNFPLNTIFYYRNPYYLKQGVLGYESKKYSGTKSFLEGTLVEEKKVKLTPQRSIEKEETKFSQTGKVTIRQYVHKDSYIESFTEEDPETEDRSLTTFTRWSFKKEGYTKVVQTNTFQFFENRPSVFDDSYELQIYLDGNNKLSSIVDNKNNTSKYIYNPGGWLIKIEKFDLNQNPIQTTDIEYDAYNWMIKQTIKMNPRNPSDNSGQRISYDYNLDSKGNVIELRKLIEDISSKGTSIKTLYERTVLSLQY